MAQPPERLIKFLADYSAISDPSERMEWLIDFADRFREVAPEIATRPFDESHRVPGCESEAFVWCTTDREGDPAGDPAGALRFHFAVENPQGISAKAFAAILDETLSAATPEEILAVDRDIVYQIFGRSLGMGKGQGLMGILFMIQALTRGLKGS